MGRKKKSKLPRPPQILPNRGQGVRFAIEENADEIFRDFVFNRWSPDKLVIEPDPKTLPKNKTPSKAEFEIDLHGMSLDEAIDAVDQLIRNELAKGKPIIRGKIITGKGRRSTKEGGGVLARYVHSYVLQAFHKHILYIDESPADVAVGGVPIRGHFCIRLKP